jgi:hypothetical protein
VATDLSGNFVWYYYPKEPDGHGALLTRPLENGIFLTFQDDYRMEFG